VIVFAGLVLTPDEATMAVNRELRGLVGPEGAHQIAVMVEHVRASQGGSFLARVVGSAIAVSGATGVMIQLQAALNRAWGVAPDPAKGGVRQFVVKRLVSFAMILGIAFLLLVSLLLTAILAAIADRANQLLPAAFSVRSLQLVNIVVSWIATTLLFGAIYKVMPEAQIRWRDVVVGALFTSTLFSVGKLLIGVYLGNSGVGNAYGAASSLAIVLVWVYYSSALVLFGAEFTQVWSEWSGAPRTAEEGAVLTGRGFQPAPDPDEEPTPPAPVPPLDHGHDVHRISQLH
jgi:membrane protein